MEAMVGKWGEVAAAAAGDAAAGAVGVMEWVRGVKAVRAGVVMGLGRSL